MTYTKEMTSLQVERYIDEDGKPTCIGSVRTNDACPFLMVSHFGTKEHCFWEVVSCTDKDDLVLQDADPPVLQRRDNGTGRLIPHCACPVWKSQWTQENI